MPQLDFYSYATSVLLCAVLFFVLFIACNLVLLAFSFRQLAVRAYFTIENIFQFVGGAAVLNGVFNCFVQKEQLVYRFNVLLISSMI